MAELNWSEPTWEETPPEMAAIFDAMVRAQRIAENRCPTCGEGPLDHCRSADIRAVENPQ